MRFLVAFWCVTLLLHGTADQRDLLQLAWTFRTVSSESSLGTAKAVRALSLAQLPLADNDADAHRRTILPVVDKVENFTCGAKGSDGGWKEGADSTVRIGRTVWAHFDAPNYLVHAGPGVKTFWNYPSGDNALGAGTGTPRQLGTEQVHFVIRIPCSALHGSTSAASSSSSFPFLLEYGHGLFGSRAEALDDYLGRMGEAYNWLVFATDWAGMSQFDVPQAVRLLGARLDEFAALPQRTVQGFAHMALLLRLMGSETLAALPELRAYDGSALLSPRQHAAAAKQAQEAIQRGNVNPPPSTPNDREYAAYYGNSQGSVVGCGYLAFNTELKRGVCGVPGCPFALILSRSKDFAPFYQILQSQLTHAQDVRLAITMLEMLWQAGESGGWLDEMHPKQVLLQAGLGDAQVSTLGAELMARAYNASTVHPQTRPVWGVEEQMAPFRGSALVEFEYQDVPDSPATDTPRTDGKDVHECVRRERAAQDQMRGFVERGLVTQQCVAPNHTTAAGAPPLPQQQQQQQQQVVAAKCVRNHCPRGNSEN